MEGVVSREGEKFKGWGEGENFDKKCRPHKYHPNQTMGKSSKIREK